MSDTITLNPGVGGSVVATDDIGGVHHQRVKLSLGADGTAADAPVGGGVEAGVLRVTIASDSTGVVSVDDNGSSLTVDAPVGTPAFVRLSDGSSAITTLPVSLASVPSHAVTNAGTFATQATLAAETTKVIGTVNVAAAQTLATVTTVGAVTAITNALPAGTNNIGDVDIASIAAGDNNIGNVDVVTLPALPAGTNNIGDVDVLSIIPGTGATNLGKAEDAAHASGDTGVMALAVRRDADTTLAVTDGDYVPLQCNAAGSLKVAITAGAGSGGTSIADGATFTRDTTSITPIGAVVETSAPTLTNGDAAGLSMTTSGAVRVAVASGGVAGIVEDSASAGGEEGIMLLAVRRDVASSGVSADGDFAALSVTSDGSLRVSGGGGGTQYAVDAVGGAADTGTLALAVRDDVLATLTPVDGDYTQPRTNARGALWVALDSTAAQTVTVAAGTANIGDVDVLTVPADPFGANADAGSATGSISAKLRFIASTGIPITGTVTVGSHAVTNSGTFATQSTLAAETTKVIGTVNIAAAQTLATVTNVATIGTSVTPGTSAAHLGKAEDAAHASGDTGVMSLAVRSDTAAASSGTTGDYEPLHTDSVGAMWTRSTGELADDAAFTPGTSRVLPVGFHADETATDSVDEGDVGAARMTLDRKQIVAPYAHTAGGATPGRLVSAASTNGTVVKASGGTLYALIVVNLNAAVRYLKVYNSTSVTVGTTTPTWTFPIPASTTGAGIAVPLPACGVSFGTGLCLGLTTGIADNDTGAVAANEICVNYAYL